MDNKKTVIIGFANLYLMPYIKRVRALLEEKDIPYDIIYWDREDICEEGNNLFAYREVIDSSQHVIFKLLSFFKYRRYVLNTLKQNKYDKIFVFYTIPAVLIKGYLKRNYKNNYIFAYSDYTFETSKTYKKWTADVVRNSYATTVTSLGFTQYLPDDTDYNVAHNCGNYKDVIDFGKGTKKTINITYAGMVRDIEHITKQIDVFGNDKRFKLHFYGSGLCIDELRSYIADNDIKNVLVHGRFTQDEKTAIMEEADIINNSLANDNFQNLAMTNRMYDALYHTIPQMVTKGSYSDTVVNERGIGTAIDLGDKDCADKLYQWYNNIGRQELSKNCTLYVKEINEDMNDLQQTYLRYLGITME